MRVSITEKLNINNEEIYLAKIEGDVAGHATSLLIRQETIDGSKHYIPYDLSGLSPKDASQTSKVVENEDQTLDLVRYNELGRQLKIGNIKARDDDSLYFLVQDAAVSYAKSTEAGPSIPVAAPRRNRSQTMWQRVPAREGRVATTRVQAPIEPTLDKDGNFDPAAMRRNRAALEASREAARQQTPVAATRAPKPVSRNGSQTMWGRVPAREDRVTTARVRDRSTQQPLEPFIPSMPKTGLGATSAPPPIPKRSGPMWDKLRQETAGAVKAKQPSARAEGEFDASIAAPKSATYTASPENIAIFLRMLLKATREDQRKSGILKKTADVRTRNSWRQEAMAALNFNPHFGNNALRHATEALRESDWSEIEGHLKAAFSGKKNSASTIASRVNDAKDLYEAMSGHKDINTTADVVKTSFADLKSGEIIKEEKLSRPATRRTFTKRGVPDTEKAFRERLNASAAKDPSMLSMVVRAQAQHQQNKFIADISEEASFGGPAYETWKERKGSSKLNPIQDLKDLLLTSCNEEFITIDKTPEENAADAFRAYHIRAGNNMSLSSHLNDRCFEELVHDAELDPQAKDIAQSCLVLARRGVFTTSSPKESSARVRKDEYVPEAAPAATAMGAARDESEILISEMVARFEEQGIKHVFFDLDDTLLSHVILDNDFRERLFGPNTSMSTNPENERSYANEGRQNFYHNKDLRQELAGRVTDPDLVLNFMNQLAEKGIEVHINTLNSSTLAKVLCEERNWPVSSISAADGQIIGRDKVAEPVASVNGVSEHLDRSVKTEGRPRKIDATLKVIGRNQVSQVAFFDDDFSKAHSTTRIYLEAEGATCLMQGESEGVRFDREHSDFKEELSFYLENSHAKAPNPQTRSAESRPLIARAGIHIDKKDLGR